MPSTAMRFAEVAAELDRQHNRPTISAVVIAQNDEETIAESVGALVSQEIDQPFEVIVVTSGPVAVAGSPPTRRKTSGTTAPSVAATAIAVNVAKPVTKAKSDPKRSP